MSVVDVGLELAGRYQLGNVIGSGSTGTVWEGKDLVSGETVAVKILHPVLCSSPLARRRFSREAAIARALQHPNCMRMESHGITDDGRAYLIMERLTGQTLASLLRERGPLPSLRAIRIVAQILDAMVAAHRIGLIHRDLKPGNVMVTDSGADAAGTDLVKVCDFGLATLVDPHRARILQDSDSMISMRGEICGTPEYMAPEQALGEPLDARSDLYAIAVILFQAVVGDLPYKGSSPLAVVTQHLTAPRPRASAVRPDRRISPALDSLILRGMAKDRRERPSSAEVFRADLLQIERDYSAGTAGEVNENLPLLEPATLPSASAPGRPSARRRTAMILVAGLSIGIAVLRSRTSSHDVAAPKVRSSPPSIAQANAVGRSAANATPNVTVAHLLLPERPSSPRRRVRRHANRPVAPRAIVPTAIAPGALIEDAEDLLARGDIGRACGLGELAAQQAPDLAAARAFLGRCYMRLGRLAEARANYRRYLTLLPSAPDAPFVRAIIGDHQP
jgi:eukaryotic-like serine/threonine-protein kinase